jgi:hypothetical protein
LSAAVSTGSTHANARISAARSCASAIKVLGSREVCIQKIATYPQMEHCYCISFFEVRCSRRRTRMPGRQ